VTVRIPRVAYLIPPGLLGIVTFLAEWQQRRGVLVVRHHRVLSYHFFPGRSPTFTITRSGGYSVVNLGGYSKIHLPFFSTSLHIVNPETVLVFPTIEVGEGCTAMSSTRVGETRTRTLIRDLRDGILRRRGKRTLESKQSSFLIRITRRQRLRRVRVREM